MRDWRWPRWVAPVAIAVLVLVVLPVLYVLDPTEHPLPKCLVRTATGWFCPGCGSQRAVHNLLNLNLGLAFRFNPLVVVAIPIILFGTLKWALTHFRHGHWRIAWRAPGYWIWALLLVIVLFTILRNIPVHPFTLLAPPT